MTYTATLAVLQGVMDAVRDDDYAAGFWLTDTVSIPNLVRGDADAKREYRATLPVEDAALVPADGTDAATCHVPFIVRHRSGVSVIAWRTAATVAAADGATVRGWMDALRADCAARVNGGQP
jgi:hypothetical protein